MENQTFQVAEDVKTLRFTIQKQHDGIKILSLQHKQIQLRYFTKMDTPFVVGLIVWTIRVFRVMNPHQLSFDK